MITKEQLHFLTKKKKANESVVLREYLQLLFLSKLYAEKESAQIFFKGGTALHFIYNIERFSEDLDFTVELPEKTFLSFIKKLFSVISKEAQIQFKEKKTISGRKFLLTAEPTVLSYKTFISLDFSFREKVLKPEKSIIETDYPVIFTSYIYHLSQEEILAEKIRALLSRKKGRDIYDLWYLINRGIGLDKELIKEKLKYYDLKNIGKHAILENIEKLSKKEFILDMRPLLPIQQRNKLASSFDYIKDYLSKKINNWQL